MQKGLNFGAEDLALRFIETFSSILTPNGNSVKSIDFESANSHRTSLFKRFFLKKIQQTELDETLSELKNKSEILANIIKNNPKEYTKEEREVAQAYLQPNVKSFLKT